MTFEIDKYFGEDKITKYNKKILDLIKAYTSQNENALNTPLLKTIKFGDEWKRKFIQGYEIYEKDFVKFAKTAPFLKNGWDTINDPLNLALYLSYCHSGKMEFIEFLGLKLMTADMWKFFDKDGGLNEYIMRFILDGSIDGKPVMSEKYNLKTAGSTIAWCKSIVKTVTEEFIDKKFNGKNLTADENIVILLNSMSTRFNSAMRNVRGLYEEYKHMRMYDNGDIINEDMKIYADNESMKLSTLEGYVMESVLKGLKTDLVKAVQAQAFYPYLKTIYNNDGNEVLDFCKYLIQFYLSKTNNVSIDKMKNNFISVVTRSKGLDTTIPMKFVNKYQIRDKKFITTFVHMHALLVYEELRKV